MASLNISSFNLTTFHIRICLKVFFLNFFLVIAIIDGHCFVAIDIGIAVDTSRAVYEHWPKIQTFLISLIKQFEAVGKSRIGIISFSNEARIEIPFGGILGKSGLFKTDTTYAERISKVHPNKDGFQRRTDLAFDKAMELFRSGRRGVPKAFILIEHGGIIGNSFIPCILANGKL